MDDEIEAAAKLGAAIATVGGAGSLGGADGCHTSLVALAFADAERKMKVDIPAPLLSALGSLLLLASSASMTRASISLYV